MWQYVMPGTLTYKTFEDSKGYLWFLTDKGITRYDGENTRTFDDRDGYDEAGAYHVVEDASGVLYFVTTSFDLFEFSNGSFTRLKTPGAVTWVDIGSDGTVFLIFRHHQFIGRLNPDRSITQLTRWHLKETIYAGIHLANDSFILSTRIGLLLVNGKNSSKILDGNSFKSITVARAFKTKEQILLTGDSGIYALNKDMKPDLLYHLRQNEVFSICEDAQTKDIWVVSAQGLLVFKNGIHPSSRPLQFPHSTEMLSVMQSRNNSFWIATANKGIYVTNMRTKHITATDGLENDKIYFIGKESGRIYYFSDDNRYYIQDRHGIKQHFLGPVKPGERVSRSVMRFFQADDTTLFISGHHHYMISKGQVKLENIAPGISTNLICESYGHRLFRYDDGRIAVDTPGKMLISAPRLKNIAAALKAINTHMPVCVDGDTVYFTGSNMLLKVFWKGDSPVFRYWKIKGRISYLIRHGNTIHVSTFTDGFYLVNGAHITNITPRDGLLSDYCRKSFLHKGRIWLATNHGVSRIDSISPLKLTNFTKPDYLIDNDVNDLLFTNDTVYVATSSGITIFAENIFYPGNIPQVFIERLQINNRDTQMRDHYVLPYTDNNFTFHFSSPDYRSKKNDLFMFVIVQNNRTDTSYYPSGIIQLSSLMPAHYAFFISVKNIDGIWSKPLHFSMSITPPVWQTWWFMTLAGLVLLGAAVTVAFFIISRQKQQHAYKIKMAESELKSLRLYMNPHFIFNSLTSLQSFILTYQNRDAELFIAKFSKLIRSVMNFSQRGEITLEEEIGLLTNYLGLEKIRFKDHFDFNIKADPGIDVSGITIPSLLIQPFAENAIKHGFSEINLRKGILDITFSMKDDDLYCTLTDNGKGRQPFYASPMHISSGISFTEERLRLIIQDTQKKVIQLTDLEADGKPAGLKVVIYVPILNRTN